MADIGRIILGGQKGSDERTALEGIDAMVEFFSGFPVSLRLRDEVGDEGRAFLKPISKMAINDVCCLTNPKPLTQEALLKICEEVW